MRSIIFKYSKSDSIIFYAAILAKILKYKEFFFYLTEGLKNYLATKALYKRRL